MQDLNTRQTRLGKLLISSLASRAPSVTAYWVYTRLYLLQLSTMTENDRVSSERGSRGPFAPPGAFGRRCGRLRNERRNSDGDAGFVAVAADWHHPERE